MFRALFISCGDGQNFILESKCKVSVVSTNLSSRKLPWLSQISCFEICTTCGSATNPIVKKLYLLYTVHQKITDALKKLRAIVQNTEV
mmetsp:Transcript_31852/g.42081  ORF Transcript_31852/g.42081 Transcript_31852/m.42081 type:complete len:88 (+) Transcript_31852:587-850(+)